MEKGVLLKAPPVMSAQEVEAKIKTVPMSMVWTGSIPKTKGTWSLGFDYHNGGTTLKLQCVDTFPDETPLEFKEKFHKSNEGGKDVWTYLDGDAHLKTHDQSLVESSLEEAMGTVGDPLKGQGTPQPLTLIELAQYLQKKHIVFYTGAGISAGVVSTMPQIMAKLGLNPAAFSHPLSFMTCVLTDPESYKKQMDDFFRACLYGEPTPAHTALKDIVRMKNWGMLTENLDMLHQRSGIAPLTHAMPNWLSANISDADLEGIDAVVTVGLESDESGFLGWYKRVNPKGMIIAMNLRLPAYVGEGDFVALGDVQGMLPALKMIL